MKRKWKKLIFGGMILSMATLMLTGCGEKNESAAGGNKMEGNVKLWVDAENIAVTKKQVQKFEASHPKIHVTVKTGVASDAKKDVSKDPSNAADVFMFPHDQIGQMAEAGLLYPIGKKDINFIKDKNVRAAVDGVTYKGKIYGYPYGVESQVLYYNREKLSQDDITSWDKLTTKGKLGTNFGDAAANYIFAPLFVTNGDQFYGPNGEDLKGTNINNQKGVQVLEWIAKQKQNSGVVQSSDSALANLQSGKTDAFLSGPWSRNDVKKALGKKMAVAPYPTVNLGNGETQMKAFLGVKLYGVNQQTKSPVASLALAKYLSNADTQKKEFETNAVIPTNKIVQELPEVKNEATAKAVLEMSNPTHSVVMPKLPEIISFWPPMDSLINDTYKGKIKASQYQTKLDKFVKDTSKKAK